MLGPVRALHKKRSDPYEAHCGLALLRSVVFVQADQETD